MPVKYAISRTGSQIRLTSHAFDPAHGQKVRQVIVQRETAALAM